MPIYEYECQSCRQVIEKWQRITEEPVDACPKCSGSLKKLISRSSFHLKGGGWFADGYSSAPPAKKDCSETSCSDSKKCSTTSDSKPKKADTSSKCTPAKDASCACK